MKTKRISKRFQRRALGVSELTCRAVDGRPTQIIGYAVVFNSVAYGEVIRPGAFTKTLVERNDVKAYWNHNSDMILGRTSNQTLLLTQDPRGLYFEVTPNPETSWGRDALASAARGDVKGASFGFRVISASMITEGGVEICEVREVDLREVSPCADPWYEATAVEVRENEETTDDEERAPDPAIHASESDGRVAIEVQHQLRTREIETLEETLKC